jgi:hypothetical protein
MSQPIYILAASEDVALAEKVGAYLKSEGVACLEAAAPGKQDADAWSILLLILSEEASDSEEILRQVGDAIAANKILIPFRVENFRPGGEMQEHLRWRYVHEAFSPPLEKHLEELVRMIKPLQHGRSTWVPEATSLSRTLPSRAAILRKPAKPEAGVPSGIPVQVSLNFPHLILAGHPVTLQCRLENTGPRPLTQVKLLLECRGLRREVERSVSALAPGEKITLTLELEAAGFGQFNLRVNLQWQDGERVGSGSGTQSLRVHEAPAARDFPGVLAQFSQAIESTARTQEDRVVIPGSITTADELARFKLPDRFEVLELDLDFEVGRDSWQRAKTSQPLTIPAEFLGHAQAGTVLLLTPLDAPPADPHQDIRLAARPQFVLGRSSEESDFILWFWPRNEIHDTKTRRISKKHVSIARDGNRLVATNTAVGSLTTYEGQDIAAAGIELQRRGLLNLSGIYLLDVLHVPGAREAPVIANFADWKGRAFPATAAPARGSVRLLPRTAQVLPQNSTWLLSEATFGTSKVNPVTLDLPGVAEIQGRIHYLHGAFWVESLADNASVRLNDAPLPPGALAPLCTGQTLKLGTTSFSVSIAA